MHTQTQDNQTYTLEAPSKSFENAWTRNCSGMKIWYEIIPIKVRLKTLGDNNVK